MKRKDVDRLINACDAGREGELIFRLIVQHAKAKQPVQRLWLQSMTPQAIRDGFAHLRSDNDMQPLADAARCRSEADWLVGINGTRAMTAFNSKGGGFFLTTVGRVQTPTLSIVVEREEKIRRFVPRDYWEVRAEFACAAGFYEGKWFDPKFKRDEFDPEKRDSRLWSLPAAETIVAACRDQIGTVSEESKPSTQLSPLLFDLTSLQREANGRFGFSAKNTLGAGAVRKAQGADLPAYRRARAAGRLSGDGAVHARDAQGEPQLPAAREAGARQGLGEAEQADLRQRRSAITSQSSRRCRRRSRCPSRKKLYDLVVKRFLAVFFPRPSSASRRGSPKLPAITSRPKARCWSSRAGCRCTVATPKARTRTSCRCRRTRR
jgi:DNA topoisomerase-3